MTTTDSNGIVFYQDTDLVSPLHTLLNLGQTSVSTAVGKALKGPLYAANNTARDALLSVHGSSSSNPLWVDVNGVLQRHNGSSWETMIDLNKFPQRGTLSTGSLAANGTSGPFTVTFPRAFSTAPVVHIQHDSGRVLPYQQNVTTTGFNFRLFNVTSGALASGSVTWIAVP